MPHQKDAIAAACKEFKVADRCHMVMACGSGKTLAALKLAEKLKPKTIVVLVPSLALINQFMKEWLPHASWQNLKTLAVCSDDAVTNGVEDTSLLLAEVDFPTTNDKNILNKFVGSRFGGVKIIFCTYQSSELLSGLNIDLGIFDEAHKTAGYDKTTFGFALDDKRVKIKKRLFMTATPRHGTSKKNKNGEFKNLYSMDDEKIYGKRAFTLGFREAINKGLICDYKIIISVINDKKTKHDFKGHYDLQEKAVALNKSLIETGSKKTITFHSSINAAKDFCSYYKKVALPGVNPIHINATLGMTERTRLMDEFKTSKKSLVTNSRCLTEGVDVPAIDMVAFLSPKSSKIDIVQAIGRALRKSPGKKQGHIFLPLLIDEDNFEDAKYGEYEHVWQVLVSLMEQDSELEDIVKNLSRKQGGERSGSMGLEQFIQILSPFQKLEKLINVKILESLSSNWDLQYGKLVEYFKKHGHSRVPNRYDANPSLSFWVISQRNRYNKKTLEAERVALLEKLNFMWDPIDEVWKKCFEDLQKHYKKTGSWVVPYDPNGCQDAKRLHHWVQTQRHNSYINKVSPQKRKALDSIGFSWNPVDENWTKTYKDVVKFYKKNGHCNVPHKKSDPHNVLLNKWLCGQRRAEAKGYLPKERKLLLEKIGFEFTPLQEQIPIFDKGYPELLSYIEKHGNKKTKLGGIDTTQDAYLKHWVRQMRDKYKKKELTPKQIKLLEKIDIVWDPAESLWNRQFEDYKKHVAKGISSSSFQSWVGVQRTNYKKGKLAKDKIERLNEVNFVFSSEIDGRTLRKIEEYKELKKLYPNKKAFGELSSWMSTMRKKKAEKRLDAVLVKVLNEAGFEWKKPKIELARDAKTGQILKS